MGDGLADRLTHTDVGFRHQNIDRLDLHDRYRRRSFLVVVATGEKRCKAARAERDKQNEDASGLHGLLLSTVRVAPSGPTRGFQQPNVNLWLTRYDGFTQHRDLCSIKHRRQVGTGRLVVEADRHQRHLMHEAKAVLQAPAQQLAIAGRHQKAAAEKSKAAAQKEFAGKIVTEIKPLTKFFPAEGYVPTRIVRRDALAPEAELQGPAIVEFMDSTAVVPPAWTLRARPDGILEVVR